MLRGKVRFSGRWPTWQVVCEFSFCRSQGFVVHFQTWPNLNFQVGASNKTRLNWSLSKVAS